MDAQIGRVIERLKDTGEYDNTIVIYLSDHGDMLGSHGMTDKQIFYEESAHVPFIIKWSGHITPGVRSQLIGIEDISPTLLGMLGLKFSADIDGHDLSSCVFDAVARGPEYLYFHNIVPAHNAWFRNNGMWRAVTDGRYVYAADENGTPMAFYDLENDPYQLNDIKSVDADNCARMAGKLAEFVEKNDGFKPWQRLLVEAGLGDLWDKSQLNFGFPIIDPKFKGYINLFICFGNSKQRLLRNAAVSACYFNIVNIDFVCHYCGHSTGIFISVGASGFGHLGICWETDQECPVCDKDVISQY